MTRPLLPNLMLLLLFLLIRFRLWVSIWIKHLSIIVITILLTFLSLRLTLTFVFYILINLVLFLVLITTRLYLNIQSILLFIHFVLTLFSLLSDNLLPLLNLDLLFSFTPWILQKHLLTCPIQIHKLNLLFIYLMPHFDLDKLSALPTFTQHLFEVDHCVLQIWFNLGIN